MRPGEIEDGPPFTVRERCIDMTQHKVAKWLIRVGEAIQRT
jgi:hypothetical protein